MRRAFHFDVLLTALAFLLLALLLLLSPACAEVCVRSRGGEPRDGAVLRYRSACKPTEQIFGVPATWVDATGKAVGTYDAGYLVYRGLPLSQPVRIFVGTDGVIPKPQYPFGVTSYYLQSGCAGFPYLEGYTGSMKTGHGWSGGGGSIVVPMHAIFTTYLTVLSTSDGVTCTDIAPAFFRIGPAQGLPSEVNAWVEPLEAR